MTKWDHCYKLYRGNYGRNRLEMTTIEELSGLTAQHNEIIKRVVNGSLGLVSVKRALHGIIMSASKAPSVGIQVERQLETWKNLGVAISDEQWKHILQQADVFRPFTDTDEPLVSGGFGYDQPGALVKKLFDAFAPLEGYIKDNLIDDAELRYASGMKPTGGLRLVHYDPNAYFGLSALDARKAAKKDGLRLAGIEIYEHLMLEPNTSFIRNKKPYRPNASGLDRKYDGKWAHVPCLYWWSDVSSGFRVSSFWANDAGGWWSSPIVREC